MAEKLLITQALDERDLLKKKIKAAIRDAKFVAAIREKDKAINGISIDEFQENAKATYQSITDMISRYNRICEAITLSNATLTITFSDGTVMTKAEAISKKKRLKDSYDSLEDALLTKLSHEYDTAVVTFDRLQNRYETERQSNISNLLSNLDKNAKLSEDQISVIDNVVVKPLTPVLINPINAKEAYEKLNTAKDTFLTEVDSLIKVSNATNFIEF